jgi:hypothetical protein
MSKNSFFNEQTEQSLVKTTIVSKYFDVWAAIPAAKQINMLKLLYFV